MISCTTIYVSSTEFNGFANQKNKNKIGIGKWEFLTQTAGGTQTLSVMLLNFAPPSPPTSTNCLSADQQLTHFLLSCSKDVSNFLKLLLAFIRPAIDKLSFVMSDVVVPPPNFLKVFKNRAYGDLAGVFWGNLMQGFSVGWWKNKHNTHHAVPNLHESSADAHDGERERGQRSVRARGGVGQVSMFLWRCFYCLVLACFPFNSWFYLAPFTLVRGCVCFFLCLVFLLPTAVVGSPQ